MSFFRRKDLSALQAEALTDHSLKRALGALNLTMLGIGAIIGAGIFVLTGQAAAELRGPAAIVLSYVLAGTACALRGALLRGVRRDDPDRGAAYTYSYATLGELVAWIIGWDLVLEYAVGAATVAVGWSGYVVSFPQRLRHHHPLAATLSAPLRWCTSADAGSTSVGRLHGGVEQDRRGSSTCPR